MNDTVTLRVACFADYPGVRDLMERYDLETKPEAQWRHLWEQNPVWQRFGQDWPIGWVLESDGCIVGFVGNIPLDYEINGRRITAAVACEWVVEKEFRTHNPRLTEAYFAQKTPDLFLNTTAIYATGRIFEKQGGARAPVSDYDVSLFWILRPRQFIKALFNQRDYRMAGTMATVAALPLRLLVWWRQRRIRPFATNDVQICHDFDTRFADFWHKLRQKPDLLLCSRDLPVLRWHFHHAVPSHTLQVYYIQVDGAIVSYASFYHQHNDDIGLRRVRLVDYQTLTSETDHLQRILARALADYRSQAVDMVEVVGFCEEKRRSIKTLAPFTRELPAWMFYYKVGDSSLTPILHDSSVWDPCSYDGDGSL